MCYICVHRETLVHILDDTITKYIPATEISTALDLISSIKLGMFAYVRHN